AGDAAPRPIRMNEEGTDAGGVKFWIKPGVVLSRDVVAAEQSLALAPAATSGHLGVALGDEVSTVVDELAIDAEAVAEGGFNLGRRIALSESAGGGGDQPIEGRDVVEGSEAEDDLAFDQFSHEYFLILNFGTSTDP